jgi:hypothetical protein
MPARTIPALVMAAALGLAGCASPAAAPAGPTPEEVRALAAERDAALTERERLQREVTTLPTALGLVRAPVRATPDLPRTLDPDVALFTSPLLDRAALRKVGPPGAVEGQHPNLTFPGCVLMLPERPRFSEFDGVVLGASEGPGSGVVVLLGIHSRRVGDELTVYRDDVFVALVVVDAVYPDRIVVSVKTLNGKPFKKRDPQVGDLVIGVR